MSKKFRLIHNIVADSGITHAAKTVVDESAFAEHELAQYLRDRIVFRVPDDTPTTAEVEAQRAKEEAERAATREKNIKKQQKAQRGEGDA